MDQKLHQGLLQGELLDPGAAGQCLVLDPVRGLADTAVLHLDAVVQAAVFQHGKEVKGQPSVVEQMQETTNVGEGARGFGKSDFVPRQVGVEELTTLLPGSAGGGPLARRLSIGDQGGSPRLL